MGSLHRVRRLRHCQRSILFLSYEGSRMSEPKHTYPSRYPPGTHWATDEAWRILDFVKPGIIPEDVRAYLAGAITGLLETYRGKGTPQ
jgi:hypothetical protein